MKIKMWGVYHKEKSIRPRSLHFSKWDAKTACRNDWFIRRVELTIQTGTSYEICFHSYKHLDYDPMSKKEKDYYEKL